jgi:hypothetical protein
MRKRRKSPRFRVAKAPPRRFLGGVSREDDTDPDWQRLAARRPQEYGDDEDREYDFGFEEEGEEHGLELDLLQALRSVEHHCHWLERGRARVARLLRNNPQLAAKWKQFTSEGGIGAKDFENFRHGKFRCRLTRGKKHLRLVSSRNPPSIWLRRSQNDDPDEAA